MLRSIDFKTMPYLFTDKAGTCLTVEFDGRELDDIYQLVQPRRTRKQAVERTRGRVQGKDTK